MTKCVVNGVRAARGAARRPPRPTTVRAVSRPLRGSAPAGGAPAPAQPAVSSRDLLREELRPERRRLIITFVLSVLGVAESVLIPLLAGFAVDDIQAGRESVLLTHAGIICLLALVGTGVATGRTALANRVSFAVITRLRGRLYGRIQRVGMGFFDRNPTGEVVARLTADLTPISQFLGPTIGYNIQAALTMVGAAIALVVLDPVLAVVTLAPLLLLIVVSVRYSARARPAYAGYREAIADLTQEADESISGAQVVRAFGREDDRLERFRRTVRRAYETNMAVTILRARYSPAIYAIPDLAMFAVLSVGAVLAVEGDRISAGTWVSFFVYVIVLVGPAQSLGQLLALAEGARAALDRVARVLSEPVAVHPSEHPDQRLPEETGVELRGTTLEYGPGTPALEDVSFNAAPGSVVALVGPTGAGKTTALAAIAGLYDPQAGEVRVADTPVMELDVAALRHGIALAASDAFIVSGTVRDNVTYGRADADDAAVEAALRGAQAWDFVRALPEGLETELGVGGATLSGGQRQRIALARSLLVDARVLMLDRATSSLDARTQADVWAALEESGEDRTVLFVAERAADLRRADRVVLLDGGRVVAAGPPHELEERVALFRELEQAGEEEDAQPPPAASPTPAARAAEAVAPTPPAGDDDGEAPPPHRTTRRATTRPPAAARAPGSSPRCSRATAPSSWPACSRSCWPPRPRSRRPTSPASRSTTSSPRTASTSSGRCSGCSRARSSSRRSPATSRPTSSAGSGCGRSPSCGCGCSATSSACPRPRSRAARSARSPRGSRTTSST